MWNFEVRREGCPGADWADALPRRKLDFWFTSWLSLGPGPGPKAVRRARRVDRTRARGTRSPHFVLSGSHTVLQMRTMSGAGLQDATPGGLMSLPGHFPANSPAHGNACPVHFPQAPQGVLGRRLPSGGIADGGIAKRCFQYLLLFGEIHSMTLFRTITLQEAILNQDS